MTWWLGWTESVLVLLAAVGAWTLARAGGEKLSRRWLLPRLTAWHLRHCNARNRLWTGRLVRHATTGRVGLCVGVCTRRGGWLGLVPADWVADVWLSPETAAVLTRSIRIPREGEGNEGES